ncbi:uncharacterized protein [Physcomitrium patens]|uniref:DUF641 domain-containing protein n=1 Tax=Physcomitrium patens TaxID=3218 RepID=A0A2K1IMM3_PHYPA|nr:uncharacterized protein LOC112275076 [Physcomitrium patens]PNR30527.1 hypothetical protein PHYPA_026843 [Physcomitrium patens]|eukprot:XP_024360825.1 uncharacterized protein LOC112275076 [Physcomitrella patens]
MGGGEDDEISMAEVPMQTAEKERVDGFCPGRVEKTTEGGAKEGGGPEVSLAIHGEKSNKQDESRIETNDSSLANDKDGSQQVCSGSDYDGGKSDDVESTGGGGYPKTNEPIQDASAAQIAQENNDVASFVAKFEENTHRIKEMKDIVHSANVCAGSGRGTSSERKLASGDLKKNSWGAGTDHSSTREESCPHPISFSQDVSMQELATNESDISPHTFRSKTLTQVSFIAPQEQTGSRAEDACTTGYGEFRDQIEERSSMLSGPAIQENTTSCEAARSILAVPDVNEQIDTRNKTPSTSPATELHEQIPRHSGARSFKSGPVAQEQDTPNTGTSNTTSDSRAEEHMIPCEEDSSMKSAPVAHEQDTPSAGTSNTTSDSRAAEHMIPCEEDSSMKSVPVAQEQDTPSAGTSNTTSDSRAEEHMIPSEEASSMKSASVAQEQDTPSAGTSNTTSDSRAAEHMIPCEEDSSMKSAPVAQKQDTLSTGTSKTTTASGPEEHMIPSEEASSIKSTLVAQDQDTAGAGTSITISASGAEESPKPFPIPLDDEGKEVLATDLLHLPKSGVSHSASLAFSEGPALQHERKDPTESAPCSHDFNVLEDMSASSGITKPATSCEPSNVLPQTEESLLPSVSGKIKELPTCSEALSVLPESNKLETSGSRLDGTQSWRLREEGFAGIHVRDFEQLLIKKELLIGELQEELKRQKCVDQVNSHLKHAKEEHLRKRIEDWRTACMSLKETLKDKDEKINELHQHNSALWKRIQQLQLDNNELKNQLSRSELQRADELLTPGSYLDDTKAATPALFVNALNAVKDASINFCKLLRPYVQNSRFDALQERTGAVSRSGHSKFQHQAFVCSILFESFEYESFHSSHASMSKPVWTPQSCFQQYQVHDIKKFPDMVERVIQMDSQIDKSLRKFCFERFFKFVHEAEIKDHFSDSEGKFYYVGQNPQDLKFFTSFCKLAVSVWLLHRLAFSFRQPARKFIVDRGISLDLARMCSVVPLDDPSSEEEVQGLKVGFYVLPGFDIGNSTIPCEVYVRLK